jgi:hypothetical protein
MTLRRIDLLDSIGFDWGARRGKPVWEARYAELRRFYEGHGHSNFRTRDPVNSKLGRWITEQRRLHRQMQDGTLQGEELELFRQRVPRLESIQFRWSMQGQEGEEGGDDGDDDDDGSNTAAEDE